MRSMTLAIILVVVLLIGVSQAVLAQTGTITGFVRTAGGVPIPGASVSINPEGRWTVSISNGSYVISGVPAGTYTVKASKVGYASIIQSGVTVTAGQTTSLNFNLGPAGTLAGYVRDEQGSSVQDAVVTVSPGGYSATTSVSGTYIITDISPGIYQVTVSKAGYAEQVRSDISVQQGEVTICAFTLGLNMGAISGFVRDINGNPIQGADVVTDKGGFSTTSGTDGWYLLSNVTADTYNVTASKSNYQSQMKTGIIVTNGQTTTCDFNLTPLLLSGTNIALNAATYLECGHNESSQIGLYARDGSTSTKWCCLHNGMTTPGDHTLAYDLGSNCSVSGFVVKHASTGGETASFNTKSFVIESAPSLSGPWTEEFSVTNNNQEASNRLVYSVPKTLRFVRLRVTQPNASADWAVRIPEFEVWGTAGVRASIRYEAEDYDSGASAVQNTDYYDTTSGNAGGKYRSQDVDIENCSEGGYNVGWLANGEWLRYRFKGSGNYRVSFRCDGTDSGACHLEVDGVNKTGTINIPKGSWQVWQTYTSPTFYIAPGDHILKFVVDDGGFNINYFTLEPQ